jgi:large subunit ribosomal protein L9
LASTSGKSWSLQTATFVPPASASLKRSEILPSILSAPIRPATQLLSKKKAAPAAVKKIQVKMLKYVAGTGSVGEIVMVTPAFFNNKLRPSSSAVMISDEEVAKAKAEAAALEKETNAKAEALKERMDDLSLQLKRKAGPDGQLFGGIGPKAIVEELNKVLADDFLHHKGVRIAAITDSDGNSMQGDIKHTGEFGATLSLTRDISATFAIIVEPES